MTLTPDQIKELKSQLMQQIAHLPPEQKKQAIQQINTLSPQALEQLLHEQQQRNTSKTIFRMIVDKEVESVIVGENADALAVLDINPISKGHILIIPKKSVSTEDKLPQNVLKLANELSKKVIENLKAKTTKIESDIKFGEAIINIIPIYDTDLNKNSLRNKTDSKDLIQIKKTLEKIKIEKTSQVVKINKPIVQKDQIPKLKKRIP